MMSPLQWKVKMCPHPSLKYMCQIVSERQDQAERIPVAYELKRETS